ncbi:MAG: hypothetical protein EZS28_008273 [Streblomastix strix]|uniref:Uncharacterized protein n=1 Tax=Streblomastix strix TaxID=222440 RepID=A0A5J4WMI5_9EUKA|nr:MAG: hypothetical protein EZS28_008273 [Streblomastix strix]
MVLNQGGCIVMQGNVRDKMPIKEDNYVIRTMTGKSVKPGKDFIDSYVKNKLCIAKLEQVCDVRLYTFVYTAQLFVYTISAEDTNSSLSEDGEASTNFRQSRS